MKYLDLLGIDLKNEVLCDLFETYDVSVIYEYDRTHEGFPDEYHAKIPDLGLEFIFNVSQLFKTLFIEQVDINTFNPFDGDDNSLKKFESKSEALQYSSNTGKRISKGSSDFMGEVKDWVRFEYGSYSIHYEYVDSKLRMITIQSCDV